MKKVLIKIFETFGFRLVKSDYYKNLINVNTIPGIDCHYLIKKILNKKQHLTCLDIGANVGQTEKVLRTHYPNATIYSFEPIKSTFQQLTDNVSVNTKIFNYAMGSVIEKKEVFHRKNSEWNSLLPDLNEAARHDGATSEIIQINTVDNFVRENNIEEIDFLKSDTEGFELEVLKGAESCLINHTIDFLYFEVGFSREDKQHTYWIDIIEYLEKYNYKFSGLFEISYSQDLHIQYANALFCYKN